MPREVDPRADAQGGHPLSRAVPPMAPTARALPQALRASRIGGAGGPQLVSFAQKGQGVQSTPSSGNPSPGQGGGYGPSGWTSPVSSLRSRWIGSTMAVGTSGWPVAPPRPTYPTAPGKAPPRVIGQPRTGPGSLNWNAPGPGAGVSNTTTVQNTYTLLDSGPPDQVVGGQGMVPGHDGGPDEDDVEVAAERMPSDARPMAAQPDLGGVRSGDDGARLPTRDVAPLGVVGTGGFGSRRQRDTHVGRMLSPVAREREKQMDKRPRGGLVPEARAGMPSGPMDSGGAPLPGSPSRATFWGGGGTGDGGGDSDGGGSAAGASSSASAGASMGGMSAGSLAAEQQDSTFGIFGLSRGSTEVLESLGQYVTGPVKPSLPWKPKPRPVLGGNQGDPVQVQPLGDPSGGIKTGGGGLHGSSGSAGDDNGSGGSGVPQVPNSPAGSGAPVVTGGRHAARATLGNASGGEGGPPLAPPSLVAVPFGVDTSGVLAGGAGESAGEQLEGGGGNWGGAGGGTGAGAAPAAYAGPDDNWWAAPGGVAPGPPTDPGTAPPAVPEGGWPVYGGWTGPGDPGPGQGGPEGISRLHVRRADGNAGAGMGSNARCGPMVVETRHGRAGNGGQSLLALCRRRGRLGDRPGKPDEQAADGRSGGPRVSYRAANFDVATAGQSVRHTAGDAVLGRGAGVSSIAPRRGRRPGAGAGRRHDG